MLAYIYSLQTKQRSGSVYKESLLGSCVNGERPLLFMLVGYMVTQVLQLTRLLNLRFWLHLIWNNTLCLKLQLEANKVTPDTIQRATYSEAKVKKICWNIWSSDFCTCLFLQDPAWCLLLPPCSDTPSCHSVQLIPIGGNRHCSFSINYCISLLRMVVSQYLQESLTVCAYSYKRRSFSTTASIELCVMYTAGMHVPKFGWKNVFTVMQ